MGVFRSLLRDDAIQPVAPAYPSVRQMIDDDPVSPDLLDTPEDHETTLPTLTVKVRSRIGYDDDGNPLWRWVVALQDKATYYESLTLLGGTGAQTGPQRRLGRLGEFTTDAEAGKSTIVAQVTMVIPSDYSGPQITESAKVYHENGERYDVVRVIRHPESIDMEISRGAQ